MGFIVLFAVVMLILHTFSVAGEEKKFSVSIKNCRFREEPHKWSYNRNDTLQCIECGFIAGTEESTDEE